jgi:hypothetical protein
LIEELTAPVNEQIRALEERWRATGLVEDEAALVQAKFRAGVIAPEAIEAAALLGSAAARSCLSTQPAGAGDDEESPERHALLLLGKKVAVRFVCDAIVRAAPPWETLFPEDNRPLQGLKTVQSWLEDRASEDEVRAASNAASDAGGEIRRRRFAQQHPGRGVVAPAPDRAQSSGGEIMAMDVADAAGHAGLMVFAEELADDPEEGEREIAYCGDAALGFLWNSFGEAQRAWQRTRLAVLLLHGG